MKSLNVIFSLVAFLEASGIVLAVPTWPSPITDELEDIMFLIGGYDRRGFGDFVTPCSFGNRHGRIAAAEWIRNAYHDMSTANIAAGTGGLDASIMFEVERSENIGAAFNTSLGSLSGYFSSRASMSDLIALSVYTATRSCGGPVIPIRAGRIDASAAGPTGVPLPEDSTQTLIEKFAQQGFNQSEMVGLVACGHTLGGVHGEDFPTIVTDAGTDGNNFTHFDSTGVKFDNRVCTEYLNSNTTNPLVMGPDKNKVSDLRVFEIGANSTMIAMSDPAVFRSTCASLMQRMIDTVPAQVILTDPIQPYEVKPMDLKKTVSVDGENVTLSGALRVRTTIRSSSEIASVQLLFIDRNGAAAGNISAPSATYQGGSGEGFDEQFQFYEFSAQVPQSTSITAFTVVITLNDGTVEIHDNNGAKFPVQDAVMLQWGSSCRHRDFNGGENYMTIVAAVNSLYVGQDVSVSTTVRVPRQGVIVPALETFSTPMTYFNATSDYLFYTAKVPVTLAQTADTYFDIIAAGGSEVDSFKDSNGLSLC